MAYPEWVEKQRRPGTNIAQIRGKFYLYEVSSAWDKEKKRAVKKTGKYLGRITEEGLIPPKKKDEAVHSVATKEYGASRIMSCLGSDIYNALKERFGTEADTIFTLAILRAIENARINGPRFFTKDHTCQRYSANCHCPAPASRAFCALWVRSAKRWSGS